jgi:hypothetical protein
MNITALATDEKVNLLAEIATYGLEHTRDDADEDNWEYRTGGYETVGHILSCFISQHITHKSEPTSDIINVLRLDEYPTKEQIKELLLEYLIR